MFYLKFTSCITLERLHLCREERERIIDRSNPTELFDEDGEEGSEENVSNRNTSQGGWNVLNADDDGKFSPNGIKNYILIRLYFHL